MANPEECAQLLRRVASTPSLSPQYWLTLHCLLRHFARVCQNCSKNLLSARALGEIFSPVFFRQQATRWVSEQPDRALLLHSLSKIDTVATDRQTSVQAQSCKAGAHRLSNMHTCRHISGKHPQSVRHSWLSAVHTYRSELFYLPAVLYNKVIKP